MDTIANRPAEGQMRAATLCQVLHALATGQTTARQLAQVQLDAIARLNPVLNAYVGSPPARAASILREAEESDARRAAGGAIGRLDGITVAIKDNIDVAGWPTTCGLGGSFTAATDDAQVVRTLRGAGAVILGKTGLDEGAIGADGSNAHHGDVQNPWRPGFSPGGSSAGAAAAVAAGLCTVAIGSDTLGSTRIPASYCGVYGLKPTPGEVSTCGMRPAARRLDSIGLLARSVDDLGVLLHVLAGYDAADPRSRRRRIEMALPDWEPGRLRVGVFDDLAAWGADAPVMTAFDHALASLQHELPNRQIVDFADFPVGPARRAAFFLIEAEMLATYADVWSTSPAAASPRLRTLLDYARGKSAADYVAADRMLDAAVLKTRRLFAGIDVLVTPTVPHTAFAHGVPVPTNQADFTCFANLAGCPALSLPMGLSPDGLPMGLQLLGAPGSDLRLLELGQVCAAALDATPDYPVGS